MFNFGTKKESIVERLRRIENRKMNESRGRVNEDIDFEDYEGTAGEGNYDDEELIFVVDEPCLENIKECIKKGLDESEEENSFLLDDEFYKGFATDYVVTDIFDTPVSEVLSNLGVSCSNCDEKDYEVISSIIIDYADLYIPNWLDLSFVVLDEGIAGLQISFRDTDYKKALTFADAEIEYVDEDFGDKSQTGNKSITDFGDEEEFDLMTEARKRRMQARQRIIEQAKRRI